MEIGSQKRIKKMNSNKNKLRKGKDKLSIDVVRIEGGSATAADEVAALIAGWILADYWYKKMKEKKSIQEPE